MKPGFKPGVVREIALTVTEDMCPAFDEVVVHRCLSTWSLVHQMEIAARKVLVGFLEPHEEGIGSHVSVDHLAPCKLGHQVIVRATLTELSTDHHPRVTCEVTAYCGSKLLARGRQVQVVMDKNKMTKLIERS